MCQHPLYGDLAGRAQQPQRARLYFLEHLGESFYQALESLQLPYYVSTLLSFTSPILLGNSHA
jgi:hypothetical protein